MTSTYARKTKTAQGWVETYREKSVLAVLEQQSDSYNKLLSGCECTSNSKREEGVNGALLRNHVRKRRQRVAEGVTAEVWKPKMDG